MCDFKHCMDKYECGMYMVEDGCSRFRAYCADDYEDDPDRYR